MVETHGISYLLMQWGSYWPNQENGDKSESEFASEPE
jgi:hypothetical protein